MEDLEMPDGAYELAELVDFTQQCLNTARHYGLEAEVITFALLELKGDPKLSPADALRHGLSEWIK